MKLGIIISTYNRSAYLQECLNSICKSEIPEGTLIVIVDDNSTDVETINLIEGFHPSGADVIVHFNELNEGISHSLKVGFNKCFQYGCDAVMNLDADSIVHPKFISVLTDLKNYFPQKIVSGFHSINRNKNGTDRHPIVQKSDKWATKKSIGGINMMMNEQAFRKYMEPALDKVLSSKAYNWDTLCCLNCMEDNNPPAVSIPSVVQHIGIDSAMGHTGGEEPDVACDFIMPSDMLCLPSVTLIAIEGVDMKKILIPWEASVKFIQYGDVKVLSPFSNPDLPITTIKPLKSKAEYSRFIFKELTNYVGTDFVLTIQHDGFVVNPKAWSDDFLQYDYIGAAWNWYNDENIIGNGGFSLRSKKLLDVCASDEIMTELHPEDHAIGRIYKKYLEKHHGIKFAPKEVADRFSIEAHLVSPPHNRYNGSFGFHGKSVDFSGADLLYNPSRLNGQQSPGQRVKERRNPSRMRYTGNTTKRR